MFGYSSIAQLSDDIRRQLHRVPRDIDLVVGIPRSGMIPAYMIGLFTNRLVIDLDGFLENRPLAHGQTRRVVAPLDRAQSAKHILLVDDSLASGESMRQCVARIRDSNFTGKMTTCAAIVAPESGPQVDLFFREMPYPRLFEWNALHHAHVKAACFDLDGVLCVDPSDADNDDGARYENFLRTALPLFTPTQRIGHIVSARLEKYREATERWLTEHGVDYGQLHLIDLPSHAERRRRGVHCTHKAKVYVETGASLFYESDPEQSRQIARLSGKPVLCIQSMQLYLPDSFSPKVALKTIRWRLKTPLGRLRNRFYRQLSKLASGTR